MKEKLCILVTNENVDIVRERARANIHELSKHPLLSYPMSPNGDEPITHWFCAFNANEEMKNRILALQDLSIMEMADPKAFLAIHNLQLVRK